MDRRHSPQLEKTAEQSPSSKAARRFSPFFDPTLESTTGESMSLGPHSEGQKKRARDVTPDKLDVSSKFRKIEGDESEISIEQVARTLKEQADKDFNANNYTKAEESYQEIIRLEEQGPDTDLTAYYEHSHAKLGDIYANRQQDDDAEADYKEIAKSHYEKALQILDSHGKGYQPEQKIALLEKIGYMHFDEENYSKAEASLKRALALRREQGEQYEPLEKITLLGNLGLIYYNQGRFKAAISIFEESLDEENNLGSKYEKDDKNDISGSLGLAYYEIGNYDKAQEHLYSAIVTMDDLGENYKPDEKMRLLHMLGSTYYKKKNYEDAESSLKKALMIRSSGDDAEERMNICNTLGSIYHDRGNYGIEARYLNIELNLYKTRDNIDNDFVLKQHRYIARLYEKVHLHSDAAEHYEKAIMFQEGTSVDPIHYVSDLQKLAKVYEHKKHHDKANAALGYIMHIYDQDNGDHFNDKQVITRELRKNFILSYQDKPSDLARTSQDNKYVIVVKRPQKDNDEQRIERIEAEFNKLTDANVIGEEYIDTIHDFCAASGKNIQDIHEMPPEFWAEGTDPVTKQGRILAFTGYFHVIDAAIKLGELKRDMVTGSENYYAKDNEVELYTNMLKREEYYNNVMNRIIRRRTGY